MSTLQLANGLEVTTEQVIAHYLSAQDNINKIAQVNAKAIEDILSGCVTTFTNVAQVTKVVTAAKFKHELILKLSSVNVLLSKSAATYANALKNSAQKHDGNDKSAIESYTPAKANFTRLQHCAALAHSNATGALQLVYLCFNNPKSATKSYYINGLTGERMSKEEVAEYLTASAREQLLNKQATVTNKTYNITHSVFIRAVNLHNIVSVKANNTNVNNMLTA